MSESPNRLDGPIEAVGKTRPPSKPIAVLSPRWLLLTAGMVCIGLVILLVVARYRYGSIDGMLAYLAGAPLLVDSSARSFGRIPAASKTRLSFVITNPGIRPVKILGYSSSCTCAMVTGLPLTIIPSGRRTIEVRISAKSKVGDYDEVATLFLDDPDHKTMRLRITGTIDRPHGSEARVSNEKVAR